MLFYQKLMGGITPVEDIMAHKKIERKRNWIAAVIVALNV